MKKLLIMLLSTITIANALEIGVNASILGVGIEARQSIINNIEAIGRVNYLEAQLDKQQIASNSATLLISYSFYKNFYLASGIVYNNSIFYSDEKRHLCYEAIGMCADLIINRRTIVDKLLPTLELGGKYPITKNLFLNYSAGLILLKYSSFDKFVGNADIFNNHLTIWQNFEGMNFLVLPNFNISFAYKF